MDVKILLSAALVLFTSSLAIADELTNEDILSRFEELENLGRIQQAEICDLRLKNIAMEKEINQLRENDEHQARRIAVLEEETRTMKALTGDLMLDNVKRTNKASLNPQQSIDEASKTTNASRRDTGGAAKVPVSHNRIRQLESGLTIAFFATVTHDAQHLGENQPVVFDHVITNIGRAYHASSGMFTVPMSGVYVFSTTILTYTEQARFKFVINGKSMSSLYSHGSDTYETLSMTAVFNLTMGDDVAIENVVSDKFVHGNHYSSFSGFLLSLDTNTELLQPIG